MRIHIQGDLYLRYGYDKCTVFQLLELMIFTYVATQHYGVPQFWPSLVVDLNLML